VRSKPVASAACTKKNSASSRRPAVLHRQRGQVGAEFGLGDVLPPAIEHGQCRDRQPFDRRSRRLAVIRPALLRGFTPGEDLDQLLMFSSTGGVAGSPA
jgi:hypothetical protein